jgi:hypothetical protein
MKKEKEYESIKRKLRKLNSALPHPVIHTQAKHWPQLLENILSLVDICDQFVITGAKT